MFLRLWDVREWHRGVSSVPTALCAVSACELDRIGRVLQNAARRVGVNIPEELQSSYDINTWLAAISELGGRCTEVLRWDNLPYEQRPDIDFYMAQFRNDLRALRTIKRTSLQDVNRDLLMSTPPVRFRILSAPIRNISSAGQTAAGHERKRPQLERGAVELGPVMRAVGMSDKTTRGSSTAVYSITSCAVASSVYGKGVAPLMIDGRAVNADDNG